MLRLTTLCQGQANEIERLKINVQTFREFLPDRLKPMRKTAQPDGETMQQNGSRETLDRSELGHRNDRNTRVFE